MSGLNISLNIGSRSMFTQQSMMSTTGHNIANLHTEGFSRQRVNTTSERPQNDGTGGGVRGGKVASVMDRFTDNKIIQESSPAAVFATRENFLNKIEIVFNEMEGAGLRRALNEFWDSWSALANEPESDAARGRVKDGGDSLAFRFREINKELRGLRSEANSRVAGVVAEVNNLSKQIAELNAQISRYEIHDRLANDARDQRTVLLEKLSKLVDIQFFENKRSEVQISVGNGWTLVENSKVHPLEVSTHGGELGMYQVEGIGEHEFKRNMTDEFRSGELKESLDIRDKLVVNYVNKLDDMAFGFAQKINNLHASGTGLNSGFEFLKSSFGLNPDAVSRPLPFIKDGVMQIHLVDGRNDFLETYEIEVQAGRDSLSDIVDRVNATVANPSLFFAEIDDDGSVNMAARGGNKFIFGQDSSDFITVMGLNNFFETLRGAEDIRLNDRIKTDTGTITTGFDLVPGDNRVALAINKLQTTPTMENDTITFDEYYNGILSDVGMRIQRNQTDKMHQDSMVDQFKQIRNSVSSVNLDEEVTNMVQQQKAYEASAKFTTTVSEMMETLIRM